MPIKKQQLVTLDSVVENINEKGDGNFKYKGKSYTLYINNPSSEQQTRWGKIQAKIEQDKIAQQLNGQKEAAEQSFKQEAKILALKTASIGGFHTGSPESVTRAAEVIYEWLTK